MSTMIAPEAETAVVNYPRLPGETQEEANADWLWIQAEGSRIVAADYAPRVSPLDEITVAEHAAFTGRVKVSRSGVVTARKMKGKVVGSIAPKCVCETCGQTIKQRRAA